MAWGTGRVLYIQKLTAVMKGKSKLGSKPRNT